MQSDGFAAECREVVQVYESASGPVHALREVTVTIPRASLTVVVGPSGAGKSTLLRLLGGLERPTVGEVLIGGQRTGHLGGRARRRLVGRRVPGHPGRCLVYPVGHVPRPDRSDHGTAPPCAGPRPATGKALMHLGSKATRLRLLVLALVTAVSAIAISLGRSWHVGLAMLAASVVLVGLVRFVGYFEYVHLRRRQEARILSRDTMRLRHLMPTLWKRLDEPPSRDELLDTLGHALQAAGIGFYTIFEKASGRPRVVFRWTHPSQTEAMHRDAVTARYPIGRDGLERADIEFGWLSEDGDVSPQMAILLQVVVDMLELNLRRVRSPLAPRSAEEHMVTEAAAGAAALARDSRPQLTTHST